MVLVDDCWDAFICSVLAFGFQRPENEDALGTVAVDASVC